jgi:hypothetical protein
MYDYQMLRYLKLEALWILINISSGDKYDMIQVFDQKFQIS